MKTRFIVLPDGTCSPINGCMLIDVPDDLECDDAEVWIAENADKGYSLYPTDERFDGKRDKLSYYDLINNLLMECSDEQLCQTATIFDHNEGEYLAADLFVTSESCDVLDPNHIVLVMQ